MTLLRTTAGETQLPAPPSAPAQADFPSVPVIDAPGLPPGRGACLAVGLAIAVAAALAAKWLSAGSIETDRKSVV